MGGRRGAPALRAFLDTNVIVRHLTRDSPELSARATATLMRADQLLLTDLVLAECVYVLQSFYGMEPPHVAELMRAAIALPAVTTLDPGTLLRALELYEVERIHFADAYLVANAEATGVREIISFDRSIDRVGTVTRTEP